MKELERFDPRTSRFFCLARGSALLSLAMVLSCDKTLLVGAMAEDPDAGGQGPVSATGGAENTPTLGAGGAAGATGGTASSMITAIPVTVGTSCAPISTAPGVLNPCGHAFGIDYSPDGQILAVGGDTETPSVHLWRLSDGMPLPDLAMPGKDTTYNLAFSPDGKTLVTAGYLPLPGGNNGDDSSSALLRLWDVSTGALIRRLPVTTGFYADTVAFTRDGTLLATGGCRGEVEIWRVADGTRVLDIPVPTSVHNLHFSPDDSMLIVSTVDGVARIWNVPSGKLVLDTITVAGEMADADFSPDGKQIASTGDGNVVRLWDAATGNLLQTLSGYHSAYISHVVWIDQYRLVSDDWAGGVVLYARGDSGSFAAAKAWSTGGQALGLGVSPFKVCWQDDAMGMNEQVFCEGAGCPRGFSCTVTLRMVQELLKWPRTSLQAEAKQKYWGRCFHDSSRRAPLA